jgi:hypothetical protein
VQNKFLYISIAACIIGILLLIYSNYAYHSSVYFFWESGEVGLLLFIGGLSSFCAFLARIKKQEKKDHKLFTILFVMLALFALIFAGILALFTNSNAYKVAKAYLMHDEKLETQLGNINDVSFVLSGEMSSGIKVHNILTGGKAKFRVIVKGENKYAEVTISLIRKEDEWIVQNYE